MSAHVLLNLLKELENSHFATNMQRCKIGHFFVTLHVPENLH